MLLMIKFSNPFIQYITHMEVNRDVVKVETRSSGNMRNHQIQGQTVQEKAIEDL